MSDMSLHPEEAAFLKEGPWSQFTIDLVVPFYNEEKNVRRTHETNKRLERLFRINRYIYVSNGSKDRTHETLIQLSKEDPKVHVVHVQVNQGYGYGMQQGLKESTADFIMTNHADIQFEPYSFFMTHLSHLQQMKEPKALFPIRANRPAIDAFVSSVLRRLLSTVTRREIGDFNGQPKIMPRQVIAPYFGKLPYDFFLDAALYMRFAPEEIIHLPVLQAARFAGVSSWNSNPFARFKQIYRWLKYVLSFPEAVRTPSAPRAFQKSDSRQHGTP